MPEMIDNNHTVPSDPGHASPAPFCPCLVSHLGLNEGPSMPEHLEEAVALAAHGGSVIMVYPTVLAAGYAFGQAIDVGGLSSLPGVEIVRRGGHAFVGTPRGGRITFRSYAQGLRGDSADLVVLVNPDMVARRVRRRIMADAPLVILTRRGRYCVRTEK